MGIGFVIGMTLGAFVGTWVSSHIAFPGINRATRLKHTSLAAGMNFVIFSMVALIF